MGGEDRTRIEQIRARRTDALSRSWGQETPRSRSATRNLLREDVPHLCDALESALGEVVRLQTRVEEQSDDIDALTLSVLSESAVGGEEHRSRIAAHIDASGLVADGG